MDISIKRIAAATAAATATVTAGATAAALAVKKKKDKDFCPYCEAKKLLHKLTVNEGVKASYDNGVALTPPMGWSSWNLFRNKIDEDLIKEIADAMKDSGLAECGYQYVNIDDCWQASERDENGKLQCDKVTFRSGLKALAEYVNERGLKLGTYSSNGTLTCEDYPASLRHERVDAESLAEWGIEYFKYDFCHNVPIPSEAPDVSKIIFTEMNTGKEIASFNQNEVFLKGRARIIEEKKLDTKGYVTGLDSRNGSFSLNVEAESDGEYVMTLVIKKIRGGERFIMAMVNGKDEYHIYAPKTNGWSAEARIQTTVKLLKGTNTVEFSNPVGSVFDSAAIQYKLMGRELKRATKNYAEKTGQKEKPIVYSICEWGNNKPYKWGAEAGNLWRTTFDIVEKWASVMAIYEINVKLWKHAKPGAWNDPDMLEVGNGELTHEENKAHFSLWCMMSAPLILGNDIRKFVKKDGSIDKDSKVYKVLTNKTMISIDQDPLGVQCKRIKNGIIDVLVKPLENSKVALCILNKGKTEKSYTYSLKELSNIGMLNLPKKPSYDIFEVWDERNFSGDKVTAKLPSHGVKVYIIE